MQSSLALLQDDSVEYVNRCTLLEDFKNKFETFMSADIISSFNSKSIELSKNYVQIFGQMSRLDELKKYYYQCEKAKLLEKLSELVNDLNSNKSNTSSVVFSVDDSNGILNARGSSLKMFLTNWLDCLIETWHNEIQWCKQIFNDSQAIVINLLTKSFEEFNRIFSKCINEFLDNSENNGYFLEYLSQFKQVRLCSVKSKYLN